MAINCLTLSGNLTKDATIRATSSGVSVCDFTIANNYRVKQGGEWVDETAFLDCVVFGKRAEYFASKAGKGTKVMITGELHQPKWVNKNGDRQSKFECIISDFDIYAPKTSVADEDDEIIDF